MSNFFYINNSGNINNFPQNNLPQPFIHSQNISGNPLFSTYPIFNNLNNVNSPINLEAQNEINFSESHNDNQIKSQNKIYCLECGNNCLAKQIDYKIYIQCKCGYNKSLSINEFNENQKISIAKLNCQSCANEKSKYNCPICNINLCQNCADNHKPDLNHNLNPIIQHEDNCLEHKNERYCSYCSNCKKDICLQCECEHKDKGHHIFQYYLNIKNNKKNLEKSLKIKNKFVQIFNDFINDLIKINQNIIHSYDVIYDYISNFGKFRTFDTLESLKSFNIDIFNKDFDKIINIAKEKNIIKTFQNIIQLSNNIEHKESISFDKKYNKKNQIIKKEIEIKILKNNSNSCNKNEIMKIMQLPINYQINKNEVFIEKSLPIQYNYYSKPKNISYVNENLRNAISAYGNSIENKNIYINRNYKFDDCLALIKTLISTNSNKEKIYAFLNCYKIFMNSEKNNENKTIPLPKLICAQDIKYDEQYEQKENVLIRVENDKLNKNINKINMEENIEEKIEENIEEKIKEIEDYILDQSQIILDRNTNFNFTELINEECDNLKTESFSSDYSEISNNYLKSQRNNININNISDIQYQSSVMNDSGIVVGYEILKENYQKLKNNHHIVNLIQCNIYMDENKLQLLQKNIGSIMRYLFNKTPNFISNSWSRFIKFFSYWKRKFLSFIVKEKKEKNECDAVSQNNFISSLFDLRRKYIIKNESILSFFNNDKGNINEYFFSKVKKFNEEISLLNKNENLENNVHKIINNNQVKKNYYSPEFVNFICLNIITNPDSEFLLFYLNKNKIKLNLNSSYNLEEIVYIIFVFDLILLFNMYVYLKKTIIDVDIK